MCVIAIKPQGAKMPNEENIKDMFDRNEDGAGFMYAMDGEVNIEKGFMTLRDFNNALAHAEKVIMAKGYTVEELPFILHFRITTHGGTNPANTHPFPVSPNIKTLQALDVVTNLGMVHNGIIRNTPRSQKISDTMEYILGMVMPLNNLNKDFLKFETTKDVLKATINGSRLAFLAGDGTITKVGVWENGTVEGTEDIEYSNLHHEPYIYSGNDGYNYGNYHGDSRTHVADNYVPKTYKRRDIFTKQIPFDEDLFVVHADDIIANELTYDEAQQFDGGARPFDDELRAQCVTTGTNSFERHIDRAGQVYYKNQYVGKKKKKLRLSTSSYWSMLIRVNKKDNTYNLLAGNDFDGHYEKTEVMEVV